MLVRRMVLVTTMLALVLAATPALAEEARVTPSATDDDIPGDVLPASPVAGSLDSSTDTDDVYRVWLEVGDVIDVRLTVSGATAGFDPRLFLYGPGTPQLLGSDEVALSLQTAFPKSFSYTAKQAGLHYVDVWQEASAPGDPAVSGMTSVTWSVRRPVYRFFRPSTGTHFYTATDAERRAVIATLSSLYQYEGTAYSVNPYTNADSLWRFYKPSSGTHFYTADPDEMWRVRNTLGYLYVYEGAAYNVSRSAGAGRTAVHRFYHLRNGTHFYSADEAEVRSVQATLGHVYRYEGVAFFLAQ